MSALLPTPEEVLDAYVRTGLGVITGFYLDPQAHGGCALGAVACDRSGLEPRDLEEELTKYYPAERRDMYILDRLGLHWPERAQFGKGFDACLWGVDLEAFSSGTVTEAVLAGYEAAQYLKEHLPALRPKAKVPRELAYA